jgi:hypothetical protein
MFLNRTALQRKDFYLILVALEAVLETHDLAAEA